VSASDEPCASGSGTPALPTRFRFASGSARGSSTTGDLEEQLRARLRFMATVFLVAYTIMGALVISRLVVHHDAATRSVFWGVFWVDVAQCLLFAWAIWSLRPRVAHSLAFLRGIEMGYIVSALLANFGLLYADFPSLVAVLPSTALSLGIYSGGISAMSVVAYGVMIPNTWRRSATVLAAMVALSVVPDIVNVLRFDVAASTAVAFVTIKVACVSIFALLVGYGSYRIEISDLAARAATQLGQYLIREKLGSGGMGEVYKAEHRFLRRPCAVKLIRPEHAGDSEVLQRFEREVQATAALTHPNTVAIYDYGIADDGTFYYVMEYLPGQTLEEIVAKEGPLEPARAVHLLRQVVSALSEAHAAGLTHRDIKPGNVMVCERGGISDVAKLLDFGLVVTAGMQAADAKLTQAGMILGTPAYMSPEQCGGAENPGPVSDIYSVGALAYFMLSGRSPFEGKGPVQMLMAHLGEVPPSVASLRPEVAAPLDVLVMRCLAKRPEDRYASAAELERALHSIALPEPLGRRVDSIAALLDERQVTR
jgi:hypothetical protein